MTQYLSIIFSETYKILFLLVPILVSVAMIVWLDRRVWAFVQKRRGPNVVGPFGLFQTLALIPGVSRAGITITAARFLKFNRVDSSKISFLLSIPALAGASVLSLKDVFEQSIQFNYLVVIAIISSFIFSFLTVKFFLIYINKFSMNAFVIYRIIIALILFSLIY